MRSFRQWGGGKSMEVEDVLNAGETPETPACASSVRVGPPSGPASASRVPTMLKHVCLSIEEPSAAPPHVVVVRRAKVLKQCRLPAKVIVVVRAVLASVVLEIPMEGICATLPCVSHKQKTRACQ